MIRIDHLDHLVLTVADIAVTCDFYASVLGMSVETFAEGRRALKFGAQKDQPAPSRPRIRSQGETSDTGFRRSLLHSIDTAGRNHRSS
jgi:catechol 2,3-dioxygenase-like lactoylglutathione lyase family enzyme